MSDVQNWSATAASNNSASPDGWPESMAPSGINNSARENMGAIARWYKDGNGSLSSGGSSNAYTLSPNRTIAAYAAGIDFLFLANHANTGAATLNVSGLGVKDIRDKNGDALVGTEIEQYTPVHVVYDATNGYFRATNLTAYSATTNPDASETVKGLVELATAAETLTGTSQTLAVTPYGFANMGTSFAADGYYKFPGGMILQWGAGSIAATSTASFTFPVAYTNASAHVSLTVREGNTETLYPIKLTSAPSGSLKTGFGAANPNAETVNFHYFAIGY